MVRKRFILGGDIGIGMRWIKLVKNRKFLAGRGFFCFFAICVVQVAQFADVVVFPNSSVPCLDSIGETVFFSAQPTQFHPGGEHHVVGILRKFFRLATCVFYHPSELFGIGTLGHQLFDETFRETFFFGLALEYTCEGGAFLVHGVVQFHERSTGVHEFILGFHRGESSGANVVETEIDSAVHV